MPVLSGKRGTLFLDGNEITPVSNWTISLSGNLKAYGANDTRGSKMRVSGVHDSTGTFEVKISDESGEAACPVFEGLTYDALFYIGQPGDPAPSYYAVNVMIAEIAVDDDIDDGEILAFAVTWEGNSPVERHGYLDYGPGGSSSGV